MEVVEFYYSGCMARVRMLLLLAVFTWSATADTRYLVKMGDVGHEIFVRQYFRGKDMRIEDVDASGNVEHATIIKSKRRLMYRLDEPARQYTESRGGDMITDLALLLTRAPRVYNSGKTVNVYYETIDTGERRRMFGLTARHLIIHERHVAERGACRGSFEKDREGWYMPRGSATRPEYFTASLAAGMQCRDTVVKHGNDSDPGMPLQETIITRYADPGHVWSTSAEVLEFSSEPLDESLFEVPGGFQRVGDFSWSEHLAYDWGQVERAFSSWFE